MMNQLSDEPTRPRSAFGRRVAVLGGIAAVAFAILFFRVWFLQVLSGDEYLAAANDNRTRTVIAAAPRGEIRDRDGELLVGNRASLALQLDPQRLPDDERERRAQLARVAEVADMPLRRVRREIRKQQALVPGGIVTLRRDVAHDLVYYVAENQAQVPALSISRVFVRDYSELADIAPHILGHVGEVTAEELETPRFRGLKAGDTVGKEGLENSYDEYLRGKPGETRIQVDALGRAKGQLASIPPIPGGNLRLTLDGDLQRAGYSALGGRYGAFVVMDAKSGEVLGMGSNPTYDPAVYTKPIPTHVWEEMNDPDLGAPKFNRATMSAYPTGSTFKPITALAALDAGIINPNSFVQDTGSIKVGDQEFTNAGNLAYGSINMVDSLRVSSDVYYYLLGQRMNGTLQLQNWARKLGFGSRTGIDLPAEFEGLVPTPEWRNDLAANDETGAQIPWSVGHNIQFAIGQGDQMANPLQVAVAYAAIGNGGSVVTPHLGMAVEDSAGRILREFAPPPRREVEIEESDRRIVMEGLHQAAQSPGGTAESVFGDFPIPVAGKTGTAERQGQADQAWFAALAPYDDPEVVVVATIEGGGWGAEAAAPAVRTILNEYFADQLAAREQAEVETVARESG